MLNQTEKILRWLCLILAALIVWQLGRAAFRATALTRVTIPAVPTLATNAPASGGGSPAHSTAATTNTTPGKPGTNGVSGTNTLAATNAATAMATNVAGLKPVTNAIVSDTNSITLTNQTAAATNAPAVSALGETNAVAAATNAPVVLERSETNAASAATNSSGVATNLSVAASTNGSASATNPATKKTAKQGDGASVPPSAPGGRGAPKPGQPGGKLPPEIQARLDKIVDSEIFGPVNRPQPMALLGIAGDVAFLRSPGGQTGLVKEGDSLGEIKLLRIGINRVLVEQNGQKKELTVFNGYGSESLLPKSNETSP